MLGLLTSKPVLYVCNVDEASAATGNAFSQQVEARAKEEGAVAVVISAKIEAEIAVLPAEEREEYLAAVGLTEPGLNRLIRAGYALLPGRAALDDGVGVDQELAGAGDEGGVVGFSARNEAGVEVDQGLVPAEGGRERRGVEGAPQAPAAAGDVPLAFVRCRCRRRREQDRQALRPLRG